MAPKKYSGQLRLRMPPSLHKELAEQAEQEGVSLNTLLLCLVSRNLNISAQEIGDFLRQDEGIISLDDSALTGTADPSVICITDTEK